MEERDAGLLRPAEPLGDEPFGFVPASGEEAVDTELEDGIDGWRLCGDRLPVEGQPSSASIAAMSVRRVRTVAGSLAIPVACRSMSLVGLRKPKAASSTPP